MKSVDCREKCNFLYCSGQSNFNTCKKTKFNRDQCTHLITYLLHTLALLPNPFYLPLLSPSFILLQKSSRDCTNAKLGILNNFDSGPVPKCEKDLLYENKKAHIYVYLLAQFS